MKINVIIADDEYFIRQRIKKIIPWEKLGLTFCGEAENGKQVLDLLENKPADILLLDIKMPQMDGIETARYITEHFPHIHMIILSGYNDFEYARSMLRYGGKEYLLKPVSPEELEKALADCIHSVLQNRRKETILRLYQEYKKTQELESVRNNTLSWNEFCTIYPEFSEYRHSLFCAFYVSDNSADSLRAVSARIQNTGYQCCCWQDGDCIYFMQIFLHTDSEAELIDSALYSYVVQQNVYTYIARGNIFPISANWLEQYRLCSFALMNRYFCEKPAVEPISALPEHTDFRKELQKQRKTLPALLNSQDEEKLRTYLDQVFSMLKEWKDPNFISATVTEIFTTYFLFFNVFRDTRCSTARAVSTLLEDEHSLNALKDDCLTYGLQCMHENALPPSDNILCGKVIEYIEKNYEDTTLSVAEIAAHFQLHPTYLGSVFKKSKHTSLLQYISEVRIEAAKELLTTTDLKISEIAEKTGFSDIYYFSKRFKKITGHTPKEYARKHS